MTTENESEEINTYHRAFLEFLANSSSLNKKEPNKARQKLLNLSMAQFTELSTDVYDELQRRTQEASPEHLPPRDDLHPKRNQARQKLAILSPTRFEDLSADIFYEIERRYPHLSSVHVQPATIIPTKSELVEEDDSEEEENEDSGRAEEQQEHQQSHQQGQHHQDHHENADHHNVEPENTVERQIEDEPVPRPRTLDSIAEESPLEFNDTAGGNNENNVTYNRLSGQITPPETVSMFPDGLSSDDSLRDQLKDRDEQIQMLVAEGSRMDESINKLESQLAESENVKNSLVEENSRLEQLIDELENEKEQMNIELREQKDRYEADISRYQDQLKDTERKLADVEAENVNMRDNNSDHKYQKLKKDHERLNKELEQQQKITDQVRNEASMFLEEMRTLASQSLDTDKLQELKVELQEWKSRYMRAKGQVRDLRASTYGGRSLFQPSTAPIEKDSPYYDDKNGKIKASSVTKFQVAMDEFLVKARSDSNVLDYLHYLVVATRMVTQDITDGAERATDSEEQSQIAQCTSLVSTTANHLITTTRNHATSGGLAPISVLDAAASDLSSAVIELVKVAKIRSASDADDETPPPRPLSDDGVIEDEPKPVKGLGISNNNNKEESEQVTDNHLHHHNDQYTNGEHHEHHQHHGNNRDSIGYNSDNEDYNDHGNDNGYNQISVKKRQASTFNDLSIENNFDIADPDNTVAELQGYLEEKTVGVIDSIQSLLTGIRDNNPMGNLRTHINSITASVDKMLEATGNSMDQTKNWQLKDKGSYILANLSDCSQRMANLQTDSNNLAEEDRPDRHLKQRLAGISFDMAKCTKELVKTVEEVSLNAEISQIDDQLR